MMGVARVNKRRIVTEWMHNGDMSTSNTDFAEAYKRMITDYPALKTHSRDLQEEMVYELNYAKRPAPPKPAKPPRKKKRDTVMKQRARLRRTLYAMHPRPHACPQCGNDQNELHLHHDPPTFAQLRASGQIDNPHAHNVRWLCYQCHYEEHKHEPVARIMRPTTSPA